VILNYHDKDHLDVDKTYDLIKIKYFWPCLYKQLHEYVNSCITCQQRSMYKSRPLLQETDIPPYPFAKIAVDLSGPYPTSLSGNKYIISFIDIYSGWPEAFAVPSKNAENVVHLLLEEIIPKHSVPLVLQSDNGSEVVNRLVRETLKELNISHVTTSFYSPNANGKVERLHRFLHDILAKKIQDDSSTWDVCLNQTLAAIRFSKNKSSGFSPFFLLYNRDPVLPIDNILKPRRKYVGEDPHKILLEQQHKSFVMVHKNMKKSKKKQKDQADKTRQETDFKVGDAVYYKNHLRKSKLDSKWKPFYRIIEQKSPVSFIIKNQLNGTTTKVHAQHLKPATVEEWNIPSENRSKRKSTYVVAPSSSDELDSDNQSESSSENEQDPRDKLINKYRNERESSSNEEDIPLMELKKRVRSRAKRIKEQTMESSDEDDVPLSKLKTKNSVQYASSQSSNNSSSEDDMSIDVVMSKPACKRDRQNDKLLNIFADMTKCLKKQYC